MDVWASEPLLQDPVAFCFDEKGRAFVVETGRRKTSALDTGRHEPWRIENLALRSVEDLAGFGTVLVTLKNSAAVAGLLTAEDANLVTLESLADGKKQQIKKGLFRF